MKFIKLKLFQTIQYVILLIIGLVLCWMFYKNINFYELKKTISTGDFSWFYIILLVSLFVYVLRTLRWQLLISAMGYKSNFYNAFSALSISYFISFIIPRLGEVSRCLSLKKKHDIPFMKLLGTVIIERIVDVISLVAFLLITLLLQFNYLIQFIEINIYNPLYDHLYLKIKEGNLVVVFIILGVIGCLSILFFYFRKRIRKNAPFVVIKFIEGLKQGLKSIAELKQKKLFVVYTVLIWVGYYFMTYFWFFVFKETASLTWGACLSIVAIGTIGRSLPIQGGGMGAYHFLVTSVIMLYGVSESFGKTLATLIHGGQTFFTFCMGLIGLIIFFIQYWKKK
ncbi:MAG: lysylphosphatidylglycerol synthase transmembrane domain-containing protein [Bacteroidia bacterium]